MKDYKNPDKDVIIKQLKAKIHAQNNHIIGIEQLHENATHTFFRQREQLNKEILTLKKESLSFKVVIRLLKSGSFHV